jgi:hypothetical protein
MVPTSTHNACSSNIYRTHISVPVTISGQANELPGGVGLRFKLC